jgi:WD40 repeat protein
VKITTVSSCLILQESPSSRLGSVLANSDTITVYIFDMRKMGRALNVLKDHVAAVMDVEFSPTGEELVVCTFITFLLQTTADFGF